MSLILGIALELTDEDLIELSVAALFVHVGYTVLPKDELRSFLRSLGIQSSGDEKAHGSVFETRLWLSVFKKKIHHPRRSGSIMNSITQRLSQWEKGRRNQSDRQNTSHRARL
jgi:hypothetical protein